MRLKSLVLFALMAFVEIHSHAQTKVTFEDKTTMVLDGRLMGTLKKYSYENPDQVEFIERTFFKLDEDTLEIAVYSESTTKVMDDLRIHRFHKNQLNFEEFGLTSETDFEGKFLLYSLGFSALDEAFQSTYYSYGNSKGEKNSMPFFAVNADEIEGLEALEHLISIY